MKILLLAPRRRCASLKNFLDWSCECHLVSLLQHFEKYPDDENDYREQLKQYNFFADIMRKHDPLYTDLMEHLSNQLYIDVSKIINI